MPGMDTRRALIAPRDAQNAPCGFVSVYLWPSFGSVHGERAFARSASSPGSFCRLRGFERGRGHFGGWPANFRMPGILNDPEHWLDRARSARAIADETDNPMIRPSMLPQRQAR